MVYTPKNKTKERKNWKTATASKYYYANTIICTTSTRQQGISRQQQATGQSQTTGQSQVSRQQQATRQQPISRQLKLR